MTLEEAKKVARIAGQADYCCTACAGGQYELLKEAFPEFVWSFNPNNPEDPASQDPETWIKVEDRPQEWLRG